MEAQQQDRNAQPAREEHRAGEKRRNRPPRRDATEEETPSNKRRRGGSAERGGEPERRTAPWLSFRLDESFVKRMASRPSPFANNALGEYVYLRTYSRDGERWWQTVRRVVEGTYSLQKDHITAMDLGWNEERAQRSAQEMYALIFEHKFLPPGRGLWAMGTALVHEKRLGAALNNCAFCSTKDLASDPIAPFSFLMEASMLGVGVGFDTKGAGRVTLWPPRGEPERYAIPDSREGWVESLGRLLTSYFREGARPVEFDYSGIRPRGSPLRTFGGVSSGPDPLRELHEALREALGAAAGPDGGRALDSVGIVDICNLIGKCVVSGNIRRTAEIAFGDPDDEAFLDLKNYERNPHRAAYGWTSNNSIFATIGMDYSEACKRVALNGEPGFAWLENMRAYSRMADPPDHRDSRVTGANPCNEQSLESYELCCLVECFPAKHRTLEEFKRTLKFAYLYAKTVTLVPTPWANTNRVMMRNRRIGCSVSGIAQFLAARSLDCLRRWLEDGYAEIQRLDRIYSEWFCVPRSIKTTSVKPSGTVSLLAGATPGIHYPSSTHYIRRIRDSVDSPLLEALRAAGYRVEPCVGLESTTCVVEIPVTVGPHVRTSDRVSMWEQLALAAFFQRYWSDNQVSCTVEFDPDAEGPQLRHALDFYQYALKGVSFLPRLSHGAYPQMPYERITEERYREATRSLGTVEWRRPATSDPVPERRDDAVASEPLSNAILFCDSESCTL